MIHNKSISEMIFDCLNTLFMLAMIIITIYPFWYVVMASLSNSSQLMEARGWMLMPKGFSLEAYKAVLKNPNILSGYKMTIFIVVVGTSINVLMTSIGAFVLTRKKFAMKKFMERMMIFTMYFSGGMIPSYLLVYQFLGLGNSVWALILPTAISTYNLLIMRTSFESIPYSLEESAKIDGANDFVVFLRIVLPLSKAILAVMVLFYGVAHWNAWFNAMLYIRKRAKYPLQLILREILLINSMDSMVGDVSGADKYMVGESIKYATIVVATLPILFIYPFIQKYFVKGVMIGAVKE